MDVRQAGFTFINALYAGKNESAAPGHAKRARGGRHPTFVMAGGTQVGVLVRLEGGRMLATVLLPGVG